MLSAFQPAPTCSPPGALCSSSTLVPLTSHPLKSHLISVPVLAFGGLRMAHVFFGLERYNLTPTWKLQKW